MSNGEFRDPYKEILELKRKNDKNKRSSCGEETELGFDLCDGCNLDEANTHPDDKNCE